MRERGTTRQTVVDTAVEMMERDGLDLLSLHKLPAELGIRAPSLHTSIHRLDHLRVLIAEIALWAGSKTRSASLSKIGARPSGTSYSHTANTRVRTPRCTA